jgi:hypothetical protein
MGQLINLKFNQIESFFAICQTHPLPSPTQSNKSNKKANKKLPANLPIIKHLFDSIKLGNLPDNFCNHFTSLAYRKML